MFLPRYFLPHGSEWIAVAQGDKGWLDAIYSDSVLVTQLDDDPDKWALTRRTGPLSGTPTCSSSMPMIMAVMLEELFVTDGHRVLEIGTGTGYNAALLSHRLGAVNVCTVDIDSAFVHVARAALASLGYAPECAVADGEHGHPVSAPYDRVLATCSVSRIPPVWLEQTRPGGLVLTTLNRPLGAGLVRLVVGEGATGYGRVLAQDGRFMPMRAHRSADLAAVLDARTEPGSSRTTALSPTAVLDPGSRFEFFVSLEIPGLATSFDSAGGDLCYLVHADGSWAAHHLVDGEHVVEQGGPRRLWDLVEQAYQRWCRLGEPAREEFGVIVSGEQQFFTLGDQHWAIGE